ncbi:NaeI family type II restriction endonuclease [Streptomyces sp. NPDC021212]|uniref:NaeI family type II restriction endonuclease n=1 Tax=Streptomyces sp. NPDC021212 TaxID=3365118 RepID=UPI0037B9F6AE
MQLFDLPGPQPGVCDDPELMLVRQHLLACDPDGHRFARVLRDTIDQLLDGEHTGRFDWSDLHKTEKTHAGTLVEINLQREFRFGDGQDMDYLIEGIEVDCKFSQKLYGWMIPPEALGEICLVVWANDQQSQWSAGLFRADREKLTMSGTVTKKGNRDGKFSLTKQHHSLVTWLWDRKPLQENLLLHIPAETQQAILNAVNRSRKPSGQARVSELFRLIQQRPVSRAVVRTLAQQKDYMKRVRYNGGARTVLQPEGIVIFGDYPNHQTAAAQLGIPVPQEGEFVSTRLSKAQPHHGDRPRAFMDGDYWVVADDSDPEEAAPLLPETKKASED